MSRLKASITRHSPGFTLVEVLVTLVILSIGLLGLAALQLTGLRGNNSASQRTQATLLIGDMAERMHANITAVNNNQFAAVNVSSGTCAAAPNPYCGEYYNGTSNIAAQACTPTEMAQYDINVWNCGVVSGGGRASGLQRLLPGTSATIACDDSDLTDPDPCTDGSPHTISVTWQEIGPDGVPANQTIRFSFIP